MIEEIFRKYLEIKSINDLNEVQIPSNNYSLKLIEFKDFQINKFFYKKLEKNVTGLIDYLGQIKIGLNMFQTKIF